MNCIHCGHTNTEAAKFCASCGKSIMPAAPIPFVLKPLAFAGFWFRALALLVDTVLCQIATFVIVFPIGMMIGASMGNTSAMESTAGIIGALLGILIQWLWFAIPESSGWQATIGKKMFGIIVTDEHGNRLSFGRASGRYFGKIVSGLILCIGFFMAGFTAKKQALHDIMASTLVLRKSSYEPVVFNGQAA